ncbi:MAG: glycosyltransferase [Gammaproteobacteria bacterium]|nr:glycosyltransferase [Gammaproteobacteria bacterium]
MIFITLPARDEERTIGVLLWKVRKVMADFGRPYEILALDDASADGTPDILERYRGFLPLRVIRPPRPLGYGAAVSRLLAEAVERSSYPKRDVAVTLQADFSEEPGDLVPMVKAIEGGADLVAGIPPDNDGAVPVRMRLSKAAAPLILGRAYSAAPVSDPLDSYRAYRIVVLKKAFREAGGDRPLASSRGWGANLEILSRTAPHAKRINERPCSGGLARRGRASRFRALPSLTELVSLRRTPWPAQ